MSNPKSQVFGILKTMVRHPSTCKIEFHGTSWTYIMSRPPACLEMKHRKGSCSCHTSALWQMLRLYYPLEFPQASTSLWLIAATQSGVLWLGWTHIGTTWYPVQYFYVLFQSFDAISQLQHSPGSSFQESREAWILRSSPWVCHGQDLTYSFHSHTKHDQTRKKSTHRSSQLHLGWATKHQTFHGRTSKRPHQRLDSPGFILQKFCRFGTINLQCLSLSFVKISYFTKMLRIQPISGYVLWFIFNQRNFKESSSHAEPSPVKRHKEKRKKHSFISWILFSNTDPWEIKKVLHALNKSSSR